MKKKATPTAFVYPKVREVTDDELRASLERLSQNAHSVPPLAVHRRAVRGALKGLENGEQIIQGDEVVFYQWLDESGKHLGRSCTVRVDDISKVVGTLEAFFKI